ncbi:putative ribonuclease J 2 [Staphylococcus hominis SK119]|nr:putative ribonuclease J 2 [Staphylococcus hominis SK119]
MSLVKKKNDDIRIIPLGGVGEIAKNMYIVEVDDEMFMLDAGLMFPEDEMLGVDIVIPDIQYVVENKDKLKGIFLSHGHEHAIGAVSYILEQVDAPIYGSKLTLALVKESIKKRNIKKKVTILYCES